MQSSSKVQHELFNTLEHFYSSMFETSLCLFSYGAGGLSCNGRIGMKQYSCSIFKSQ